MSEKQEQQAVGSTFEELYLEQRKKSQMLIVAVAVLAVVAVGSIAWGVSQSSNQSRTPGNFQEQGFGRQNGPSGMGGMRGGMNMNIKQFFNDDGLVKTSEVESFLNRMPSGRGRGGFNITDMIERQADQAVTDGDITQDQADALIKAFETESESDET